MRSVNITKRKCGEVKNDRVDGANGGCGDHENDLV